MILECNKFTRLSNRNVFTVPIFVFHSIFAFEILLAEYLHYHLFSLAEKPSRTGGTRKIIKAVDEHQCMIISSYSHLHRRCVAISLPAVKLAAVKYGVLTSSLRYTSLSAREMREPGKGYDDLVTLSRTGNLASVHRVTLVLSANIYFVRRWAYPLFL